MALTFVALVVKFFCFSSRTGPGISEQEILQAIIPLLVDENVNNNISLNKPVLIIRTLYFRTVQ